MLIGSSPPSESRFDRREVLRLAAPAEAQLLELREHERGEVVVEERRLDVGWLETRIAPELFGDHTHLGQPGDVLAVVARHHLALGRRALHGGGDHRRRLAKVACALGAGDDDRDAAVALLAAVEQPQHGFDDPSRVLVVLDRDRPLVEPSVRIARRVGAVDDRDPAEVLVGDAVGRHVALGVQCHPRRGRQQPERRVVRHEQRCFGQSARAVAPPNRNPDRSLNAR